MQKPVKDSNLMSLSKFIGFMSEPGAVNKVVQEYTEISKLDENRPSTAMTRHAGHNRYKDIKCFDDTRVILQPTKAIQHDYIHANWINGYDVRKQFIAAQAPNQQTVDHFWSMIWQEQIVIVVSLTKLGGPKCMMYIPSSQNESVKYAGIRIVNKGVLHRENFEAVSLHLEMDRVRRRCLHLIYYTWPDKGVPDNSTGVLNFINNINFNQKELVLDGVSGGYLDANKPHPILIHCSAGVGRTGTLIALHIACRQMDVTFESKDRAYVDVLGIVRKLRLQRPLMVQRAVQYVYLHMGVLDYAMRKGYVDPSKLNLSDRVRTNDNERTNSSRNENPITHGFLRRVLCIGYTHKQFRKSGYETLLDLWGNDSHFETIDSC